VALDNLRQLFKLDAPVTLAGGPSEDTATSHPATQALKRPTSQLAGVGALTVVLVEPSRTQSVIVRKYLHELGIDNVLAISSGEKAFETIAAVRPQAVLSAMHLQDITGVQLVQKVRADPTLSDIGCVLITSESDELEAVALRGLSLTVLLAKPFDPERLAWALRHVSGQTPSGVAAHSRKKELSSLKVLLVDDSATARRLMTATLRGLGLKDVTEVADGASAMARISQESFDLVVSDYHMAGMDGRELTARIRQRSAVPILMVTAEEDAFRLEELRKAGASAFCDKNFRPEAVREIIDRLL
jgi:two-component system chemotaxis response regulator CheY